MILRIFCCALGCGFSSLWGLSERLCSDEQQEDERNPRRFKALQSTPPKSSSRLALRSSRGNEAAYHLQTVISDLTHNNSPE